MTVKICQKHKMTYKQCQNVLENNLGFVNELKTDYSGFRMFSLHFLNNYRRILFFLSYYNLNTSNWFLIFWPIFRDRRKNIHIRQTQWLFISYYPVSFHLWQHFSLLIRYARACSNYVNFLYRTRLLKIWLQDWGHHHISVKVVSMNSWATRWIFLKKVEDSHPTDAHGPFSQF